APAAGVLTDWDRICGARESAGHVRERIAEDLEALALAGRTATNLPFADAQYRSPWRAPSLRALDAALASVAGRVAALYAPAGLGFAPNPDHAIVRRLALRVARK